MGRSFRTSRLRWLFVAAVLVPCAVLAGLAVRSLNREEVFLEKRIQNTLSAEVDQVAGRIHNELASIRDELNVAAPDAVPAPIGDTLSGWKTASSLIGVPFLLSRQFEILWPQPAAAGPDEMAFLNWNREFITDRTRIPIYQNIAQLFFDQIEGGRTESKDAFPPAAEPQSATKEQVPPGKKPKPVESGLAEEEAKPGRLEVVGSESGDKEAVRKRADVSQTAAPPPLGARKTTAPATYQQERDAVRKLEQNEDLRREVYKQARKEGQSTQQRNVAPLIGAPAETPQPQESIFISEPLRFSQIISGGDSGIIPRFQQEKLMLLFWKRLAGERILGCVIDWETFRGRLVGLVPGILTDVRVLTVLDENGRPLLTPEEDRARDWRRPFAAREISEILPRWEVAAYLTDPDMIASRAGFTALIMGILIVILFITAASGGFFVLHTLRGEIDLARKKTTFVANVSHELKTPLTSIRMFAEMLRDGRQEDAARRGKYLNIMVSETERLTRLINNVLDFSRMEKGRRSYRMQRVDLVPLCEDLAAGQRVRLEHEGFVLDFSHEPGVLFVHGDPEALKQAVLNLLSNAEKYSTGDRHIEVSLSRTRDSALIEIRDRGVGIPARYAENIFKEFYRVDDSLTARVRGSGLGLPISRRIARDHGGDILYFPRDGGGSVFQIRLPLKDKP